MAQLSSSQRREQLVALYQEARGCEKCPLAEGRTQVVFGSGSSDADLMFVGEAPGFHEDKQGKPFVGQAGKLLEKLLGEIGLKRDDVFIANTLKCLRYNALVQLADGSWERIGRLVRSQYSGDVMSVDSDGRLVSRRVVGWHATPIADRPVYRLTYRSRKNAGAGVVGIELTGDHPVLTERGYVPVEKLERGDRIATGQGLSAVARDVVYGTVLGDGCLQAASAHLSLSHSRDQKGYALFKSALLSELSPRVDEFQVAAVAGGAQAYPVVHVRTLAHRALGVIRREFYRPHKTVPGWLADGLNERMLAIWFMDDGYMRIRPPRQPSAEIATVGFEHDDIQMLLCGLQRLGLPAKASRRRIFFDVVTTKALSERIAPYVPPHMRYKLHPEVEGRVPFDEGRWRSEAPEVLFDEAEVEDVTHRERNDTTFFCIDVEGTHNFVTAGGVVHNCRPPGNRDPQPAEIEQCEPYLTRQIELIQPKVICTLGNFSTKLLTGKPQGITKVHGKPQRHTIGEQAVHIYPLFHPAAALYTPAMLQTLRGDFRGLPDLLSEALPEDPGSSVDPVEAMVGGESAPSAEQLDLFG